MCHQPTMRNRTYEIPNKSNKDSLSLGAIEFSQQQITVHDTAIFHNYWHIRRFVFSHMANQVKWHQRHQSWRLLFHTVRFMCLNVICFEADFENDTNGKTMWRSLFHLLPQTQSHNVLWLTWIHILLLWRNKRILRLFAKKMAHKLIQMSKKKSNATENNDIKRRVTCSSLDIIFDRKLKRCSNYF